MQRDQINPYRPPESQPALIADRPTNQRTVSGVVTAVLVWLSAAAFITFVVVLLRSSPPDRFAGMLFCSNLLVLCVWLVLVSINSKRSSLAGYAAAVVQMLICAAMLVLDVGDDGLVLAINGGITVAYVVLGLLCHQFVGVGPAPAGR